MSPKYSLAIFDFCDTLFDGQSVSCFIDFLEAGLPFKRKMVGKLQKRFINIPPIDSKRYKEYLLKTYRGMAEEKFEQQARDFFEKIILKKLHRWVIEKLLSHKRAGDIVVVASGGFENYLKHFKEYFEVDHLFCTALRFENSRFTGFIDGSECLGIEKAERVKRYFANYDIDWERSYVYSDHHNDLPLFDLVGNKIVIQNRQKIDWARDGFLILKINQ